MFIKILNMIKETNKKRIKQKNTLKTTIVFVKLVKYNLKKNQQNIQRICKFFLIKCDNC